jgi:hypothetical protein
MKNLLKVQLVTGLMFKPASAKLLYIAGYNPLTRQVQLAGLGKRAWRVVLTYTSTLEFICEKKEEGTEQTARIFIVQEKYHVETGESRIRQTDTKGNAWYTPDWQDTTEEGLRYHDAKAGFTVVAGSLTETRSDLTIKTVLRVILQ